MALGLVSYLIKVDVDLQPGDKVTLMHRSSCRAEEKVITAIDIPGDILYFTDGTTYHHLADPDMELIPPAGRAKVLIP